MIQKALYYAEELAGATQPPSAPELRRYYARRPGGEAATDEVILRLSGRVIGYSRRAVQHAVAVHGHDDTPEFRSQLKGAFREGTPPLKSGMKQSA